MKNFKHIFLALLLVFGTKAMLGTDTELQESRDNFQPILAEDPFPFPDPMPDPEHFEIYGTVFETNITTGKVTLMHNTRYNQPALDIAYGIFDGTHELVQSTKNIPEEEVQRVKTELVNSLIFQWTEENKCKIGYEESKKLEHKIYNFINSKQPKETFACNCKKGCNATFDSKEEIIEHINTKHSTRPKLPMRCLYRKIRTTPDMIKLCAIDNIYKPATLALLFPELAEQLKEITLHTTTYEKHEENEHGTYYFCYSSYTNIPQEIIEQKAKEYAEMFKNLPKEKQRLQVLTFWLSQEVI